MTLSNLNTEKSLVENAVKSKMQNKSLHCVFIVDGHFSVEHSPEAALTENRCHRQNEQLQKSVLFLIGEPQKPQLGHLEK